MNELQQIETWNEWDDINLSTPELRQQRLEILLCQQLKNGEDVSPTLQVLEFLKNRATEQEIEAIAFQKARSKLRLDCLQKVGFVCVSLLFASTCFIATFRIANIFSSTDLPTISEGKHQSAPTPEKIKRTEKKY